MNRLLVIDDNLDHARFVAGAATRVGFDVELTDDPQHFLGRVAEWRPRACVIDLQMPALDGVQLLQTLAAMQSKSHIVLASGMDDRTVETARRVGEARGLKMAGVLTKPMRLRDVQALLLPLMRQADRVTPDMLRQAIAGNALALHYQPKLRLDTLVLDGVEALVRWKLPQGQSVAPDVFVGLAEREGLIDELTGWVVNAAVRQAAQWRAAGTALPVSINISALNLRDTDLPERIRDACARADLPPWSLILEVTETATMKDPDLMTEVLTRLRIQGFGLSLDDFGTGYASMHQLVRLPFTEIKIDRSFVAQMQRAGDAASSIARVTVDLGHSLGMQVTAEGIESQAACDMLRGFGCDRGQGELFSKPVPAEAVTKLSWPVFRNAEAGRIVPRVALSSTA
jgi:EAL domain-containing protein (putative c-di-GMP-specific phosphodiesterase class I)/ActR/RegA family two-component response regulator